MNIGPYLNRVFAPACKPFVGVLSSNTIERLKSLLLAGLLSMVLLAASFLDPIDQLLWTAQSRLGNHRPSGDIIFVSAEADLANPQTPSKRSKFAATLRALDERGVGKVYIDIPFPEASIDQAADEELAEAISELGARALIVDRLEEVGTVNERLTKTQIDIAGGAQRVVSQRSSNWMGLVWSRTYAHDIDGKKISSLAASMGGVDDARSGVFPVDYSIPFDEIISVDMNLVVSGQDGISLAGRTILIGEDRGVAETQQRVPGRFSVPYSYVSIYGAETLKSGRTRFLSSLPALAIFTLLFGGVLIVVSSKYKRRFAYVGLALAFPVSLYATALMGVRMEISYCIATFCAYSVLRSRSHWKNRLALMDSETGLPKLRALEIAISQDMRLGGHLVVARIHGYEHVLKTLRRNERAQYVHKLVDRLRATDGKLVIYSEGHHLAWHSGEDDGPYLADHLEGLRAMFAAPVNVAGSSIDVGISFGVARLDGDAVIRLAAAVAAAEESSEALQPIKFAESSSHFDELWDISLRARIDQAMAAGEVFCVYQPKIDTRSHTMTGVEALVRWKDPARGYIPPMHFIAQCEKAGRMEALTKYVFDHAFAAGRLMHFHRRSVTMSVNISATLLCDMRIVAMVRDALQTTGFDPRFLVLEVTETSRIGNLETAGAVLTELRHLGARISMDDFGVGATNFETFFELPFDEVKIDRLFTANITKSAKARAIVASVVAMGRDAHIGVVAEGAEDTETLRVLTEIGCTHVQGYVLARPMRLDNLLEFSALEETATH